MTVSRSARKTLVQNECIGDGAAEIVRGRERSSASTKTSNAKAIIAKTIAAQRSDRLRRASGMFAEVATTARDPEATAKAPTVRGTNVGLYPPRGTSSRKN